MTNGPLQPLCRGAFILLEGCDRAGKSTQAAKLVRKLKARGFLVEHMRFPDRTTPIGNMIDAYLKSTKELDDHAVHLLFSANRWECMAKMKKLLSSGTSIVVERYAYSGVTFSAAKGLELAWCKSPDIGLLAPDVTLFLDLPICEAGKREGFGEERYENEDFQRNVRGLFLDMKHDMTVGDIQNYARKTIDEIHGELVASAIETIKKCATLPLKDLWKPND
ncbi:9548_t:CDS:2 [Paraglomus brasilianum]|uniref:Thymidylate kinase n=1 Tax=Paraglomus brasilianum TaxID=144538 RepID=A0A9N8W854_9GLOM|nr:9548_t:CDS:2 [Paraglomus brasilianum]